MLTTPYDVLSDPEAVQSLTCYALGIAVEPPYEQVALLSALSNLPPVPFVPVAGGSDNVAGVLSMLTGRYTFKFPADGTGHYDIYGVILTYEVDSLLVVGFSVFSQPVTLPFVGNFFTGETTIWATKPLGG